MELLSHGYGNLKNAMNTSFNINFIHMAHGIHFGDLGTW